MNTLLLRLAAPLQSWGAGAKFDRRETQRLPTKSGVVGLLACALGRRRTESVDDLTSLIFGVRADQAGELLRDYHTAQTDKQTYVTNRYYLADAVFVAGLQGDERLLSTLVVALERPAFPLYLGRRACPPQGKMLLGIRPGVSVEEALMQEPWQASPWYQHKYAHVRNLPVLLEAAPGSPGAFYQQDAPLSFDQAYRQHGFRNLQATTVPLPAQKSQSIPDWGDITQHDAFADWGD